MFPKSYLSKGFTVLSFLLLFHPPLSFADRDWHHDGHHFYRYHDRPRFGLHVSIVPQDYFVVRAGGARFYYYDGLYYTPSGSDYVLVPPPVGALVTTIPQEFHAVNINGMTYYTDPSTGTYYVDTNFGYQVVPAPEPGVVGPAVPLTQPVAAATPASIPTITPNTPSNPTTNTTISPSPAVAQPNPPSASANPSDSTDQFTVNIPNDQGGFTPVVIKKSGNGFVGPQGEFYSEFPKVAQLKTMYGKK